MSKKKIQKGQKGQKGQKARRPEGQSQTKKKPGRKPGGINVSAFIRSYPLTDKASDVAHELHSKHGIKISENYIYTIRSKMKKLADSKGLDPAPISTTGAPYRVQKSGTKVSIDDIVSQFVRDLKSAVVDELRSSIQ